MSQFEWNIDAGTPMDHGIVDHGDQGTDGGVAAEKLGGKTVMPVTEIPGMVTLAQFSDPQGNVIGLVKGQQQ